MRWKHPLTDPDELSEVAQFLGYDSGTLAIVEYLGQGHVLADFPRYVDDHLIQQQQAAAAAAISVLSQSEVNGIPLFHFREGTLTAIITNLVGLINGRTVENSRQLSTRAPYRTIQAFTLNTVYYDASSFNEMLLMTIEQLLRIPGAASVLDSVNGAIAIDRARLNSNGKIVQVSHTDTDGTLQAVYVDVKRSADQLEALAKSCAAAFGQPLEIVS